jgi:hypothetical protein
MPANPAKPLPSWLVLSINIGIACHLGAIVILVLASFSGPWPTAMGISSTAQGPQFAEEINKYTNPYYLEPLHLSNDYHFLSNRMQLSVAYFEVVLKDKSGQVIRTIKFPEEDANFWVRHRQALLAQGLASDVPVQPRPGETIFAKGQKVRTVTIWDRGSEETTFKMRTVPEHLIPRERPVFAPSEWSLLLARAYMRYLGRHYGAASVELIRHSREPILPAIMFLRELPQGSLEELVCSFGEYRLEK